MAAVAGGVTLVQLRDKTALDAELVEVARVLKERLAPLGVPLIVNDRVDVALAAGADGLHVGQGDMGIAEARSRLGPEQDPRAVAGAGRRSRGGRCSGAWTMWRRARCSAPPPSRTSPRRSGSRACGGFAQGTRLPLVGIGGIGVGNAGAVIEAGADGVAVVSAILALPTSKRRRGPFGAWWTRPWRPPVDGVRPGSRRRRSGRNGDR